MEEDEEEEEAMEDSEMATATEGVGSEKGGEGQWKEVARKQKKAKKKKSNKKAAASSTERSPAVGGVTKASVSGERGSGRKSKGASSSAK